MIKKVIAVLMVFTLLLCSGCKTPEYKEVTPTTKVSGYMIGLSFDSFVIERWTRDRNVFVSEASKLGADVNVQSAGGDVKTQIDQIKHFIEIEVDAIVITSSMCVM